MLLDTWIRFKASRSAYAVSRALKDLGYNDITVAHPGGIIMDNKIKEE